MADEDDTMATKLVLGLLLVSCAAAGANAGAAGAANAGAGGGANASPPRAANASAPGGASASPPGPVNASPAGAANAHEKGKKLNKFTGNAAAIKEGRNLYLQYGCSGCHGVGGGGGMAPAISDDVWKFGSDDETLFELIKGQIPEQTMPRVYNDLPDDEVWKILAYVRSVYAGDPQKVDW
jgi:cytochrome c(L)